MPRSKYTLQFKEGDLAVVRSDFKIFGTRSFGFGPRIVGHSTMMSDRLIPDQAFLVLGGAVQAPHNQNRKIFVEVMTDVGPKVVWASAFKMKREKDE